MADVGDQRPPFDAPTTPFRKVVAEDETAVIPRPVSRGPFVPTSPPPKPSLLGRVSLKSLYLIGVSITTVAALVLTFLIFSGDGSGEGADSHEVAGLATVPDAATPSASAVALPPVPAKKALAGLSGTASVVAGIVYDTRNGISYPRLGAPWASVTHKPFTLAQRIGKATAPTSVIGSALVPGAAPTTKPSKDADYRKLAVRAATWTLTRQYPAGARLTWTASQPNPVGAGWTLGYQVTYTVAGTEQVSQALVSVVESGKAKPAMLFASIPESGKKRWRDLNTLAARIRPI
ncbi:hypothetical protein ACWGH8_02930 [Nonomuraea muscovyensis]|uniref:Uncharacterized protein n=1 Tax=Nonomuraea muscovyensis TaxID=1124761 RepID=A0A7X0CAY0_9ACTN|nr:hypothetical protein [Nonomuraea muscovyensis]MBB6350836.1 hypothetical protein [Nonomuraea muscovyensis]